MSTNNGNQSRYALLSISAKVEYALLALMELVDNRNLNEPLTIHAIAARQPIPERYLEHIFTLLRRGGIVQSQRGAKGGYVLSRDSWQITALEVIMLVEGISDQKVVSRSSKHKQTQNQTSVERDLIQDVWQQARAASRLILSQYTLQDLCQQRDAKQQKQPMYYI